MRIITITIALLLTTQTAYARVASAYESQCREQLGIGAMEELQPGIQKAALRECIRDLAAEDRRSYVRGVSNKPAYQRTRVQNRISEIGNRILRDQEQKDQRAINARSARSRVLRQQTLSTRFVPSRRTNPRTDFSDQYRQDADAQKRFQAQQCRGVPARQWAQCIREALQ